MAEAARRCSLAMTSGSPAADTIVLLVDCPRPKSLQFTLLIQVPNSDCRIWTRHFEVELKRSPKQLANDVFKILSALVDRKDPVTNEVMGRKRAISSADIDRKVNTQGRRLWEELFPPDFKALYSEHRLEWQKIPLYVLSDEPYIPWELVWPNGHSDTGAWQDPTPWCGSWHMTRWLCKTAQGDGNEGGPSNIRLQEMAIIAPTYDDKVLSNLPSGQIEKMSLEILIKQQKVTPVSPQNLDPTSVVGFLERGGYDWVTSRPMATSTPEVRKWQTATLQSGCRMACLSRSMKSAILRLGST